MKSNSKSKSRKRGNKSKATQQLTNQLSIDDIKPLQDLTVGKPVVKTLPTSVSKKLNIFNSLYQYLEYDKKIDSEPIIQLNRELHILLSEANNDGFIVRDNKNKFLVNILVDMGILFKLPDTEGTYTILRRYNKTKAGNTLSSLFIREEILYKKTRNYKHEKFKYSIFVKPLNNIYRACIIFTDKTTDKEYSLYLNVTNTDAFTEESFRNNKKVATYILNKIANTLGDYNKHNKDTIKKAYGKVEKGRIQEDLIPIIPYIAQNLTCSSLKFQDFQIIIAHNDNEINQINFNSDLSVTEISNKLLEHSKDFSMLGDSVTGNPYIKVTDSNPIKVETTHNTIYDITSVICSLENINRSLGITGETLGSYVKKSLKSRLPLSKISVVFGNDGNPTKLPKRNIPIKDIINYDAFVPYLALLEEVKIPYNVTLCEAPKGAKSKTKITKYYIDTIVIGGNYRTQSLSDICHNPYTYSKPTHTLNNALYCDGIAVSEHSITIGNVTFENIFNSTDNIAIIGNGQNSSTKCVCSYLGINDIIYYLPKEMQEVFKYILLARNILK